jgi:Iap family predicted aminopeptidase
MSRSLRGIVPGSVEEAQVASLLMEVFKEHLDWASVVKVPVYGWVSRCELVVDDVVNECYLAPYSSSVNEAFKPEDIVLVESVESIPLAKLEGKVLVVKTSLTTLEYRLVAFLAALKGARALIVPGEERGLYRVDTVLSSPGFSETPSTPLPIPVLTTSPEAVMALTKSEAFIKATGEIKSSEGHVVIGGLGGRERPTIHVYSHHDTILGDFESTSSYILINMIRSKKLQEVAREYGLVLISYTSRELGDPDLREYIYTWGERYLLKLLEERGELDNVAFSVGLGPLAHGGKLVAHGHPILVDALRELNIVARFNTALTESQPYMQHGVPSVTLSTDQSIRSRNTGREPVHAFTSSIEDTIVKAIARLLKAWTDVAQLYRVMREHAYKELGEVTLEVRVEASRALDLLEKLRDVSGFRAVTRTVHNTVYAMCTDPPIAHLESALWAGLRASDLDSLMGIASRCKGLLIVGDERGHLVCTPRVDYLNYVVGAMRARALERLKSGVDYELIKSTLRECRLREASHVEEGYRD